MDRAPPFNSPVQGVGVYTKTVVQNPVVRWILHARIRHRRLNDVVFVGEDFIQVKEVGREGRLHDVATKKDFNARIQAATTFCNENDSADEDFPVKLEKDRATLNRSDVPPHAILLTLDTHELVFVFLRSQDDGTHRFVQQNAPMPVFTPSLFQPGAHVAVDIQSRAIAVAANEKELIIYSVKAKEQLQREIKSQSKEWCPVSSQRPLQVDGVIQHMDFLIPPSDDPDHIILLLIVVDQRRTKAVRVEWYYSSGPHEAQVYPGQALESSRRVSNLLIPLQNAAFALVTSDGITLWKDLLSGSVTGFSLPQPSCVPKYPGVSGHAPIWASWAKPRRSQAARQNKDYIYLAREDGALLLLSIPRDSPTKVQMSEAGDLGCHVGTAFASLGNEGEPDILCIAGETSSGSVVSIGNWPNLHRIEERSRCDTMGICPIQTLPNWASATDMMSVNVIRANRNRTKEVENLLITSGKQPFGTVTEVRKGIEARLCVVLGLDDLRSVVDVWLLPVVPGGSLAIVLSSPTSTRLLAATAEFDDTMDVGGPSAFDTEQRTIVADTAKDHHLVQITPKGLCASTALNDNFEDTTRYTLDESTTIVAAAIIPSLSVAVTAERSDSDCTIVSYRIPTADMEPKFERAHSLKIPVEPLCITAMATDGGILIATGTNDGKIAMLYLANSGEPSVCRARELPTSTDPSVVCDHLAILQVGSRLLVVCGLRDGKLVTFTVDLTVDEILFEGSLVDLGYSTVKLVKSRSEQSSAVAMSGNNTYLVSWNGEGSSVTIENIWITDKSRPQISQGAVVACAQMPLARDLLTDTLEDTFIMVSGDDLLVAALDALPSTVPRQIPVSGTPNRVAYAASLQHIVCSGIHVGVREFPSKPHSPPEKRRQTWSTIDFIPERSDRSVYTHRMEPGERVDALLPWSLHSSTDKTYSYIIAGGSYVRSNGTRRGRVTFLQPSVSKNWEVSDVHEISKTVFDDEVYSLALYDEITYIACAGDSVHMKRFSVENKQWDKFCAPFKLASPGIHTTVEQTDSGTPRIMISTSRDSLVVLQLLEETVEEGAISRTLAPVAMGPRAEHLISHLTIPSPEVLSENGSSGTLALATTKHGRLLGMACPTANDNSIRMPGRYRSASLLFEAKLTRSLTRLVRSPPLARKGSTPSGVVSDRITGSAPDGALVSIVLLDNKTWRKLFFLQRLIEWTEVLSPHPFPIPMYSSDEESIPDGQVRALPVGFDGVVSAAMATKNEKLNDMHIDGDILARALTDHGLSAVKQALEEVARRADAVGSWVVENFEAEMAGVEGALELVRRIDGWVE